MNRIYIVRFSRSSSTKVVHVLFVSALNIEDAEVKAQDDFVRTNGVNDAKMESIEFLC
jgi:hypothetical protein